MILTRQIFAAFLLFAVVFVSVPTIFAQTDAKNTLLRGYRTGYSDGYMSGYRDSVERAERGFTKHPEYTKANRVYRPEFGALEDYRDGYQQGFEAGYNTGFERRGFESTLPTDLTRRGTKTDAAPNAAKNADAAKSPEPKLRDKQNATINNLPIEPVQNVNASYSGSEPTIIIPTNTEIIIEMLADVNTSDSRESDRFLARVVAPGEIGGAIIEGTVARVKKPGRVKGNAELQLSFNRIVVTEKRWANFNANVIEALPMKNNNIKTIDDEGNVTGTGSLKKDAVKVGAATGAGAGIGAIAGGPVGAAVGAAIGGAFGIGGVLVSRGADINLVQGQQLRVRTNFESQIR